MVRQLLVPLDGSGFGEETLPLVTAIARSSGADVAVAHVHVPHVPDHLISNTQYQYEGVDMSEYDWRDRSEEESYLRSVADRLATDLERSVEPVILEGEITEAIDQFAARFESPGMIVMATHGRSGFSRAWLGSVADAVVRNAPWPVLLIRPVGDHAFSPEDGLERILVPLDGSARSERILPHAADLASGTGAALELLRVVTPSATIGTRVLPVSEKDLREAHQRSRNYLDDVAGRLRKRDLEVHVRVIEHNQPARAILEVIGEDAPDLVAMATHGYRGVTRVVLGSVADKVLRGGRTPLLLLGPGVDG
ncbi:MAG: universal stress protein [Gemmatimonadota bacterium]|jgi:nucleotide-binding universal stress UspA family protein